MASTCLQIIQQACLELGLVSPNTAVTSTDQQILQLLALLNKEGQLLTKRFSWTALQTQATFTTLAAQLQGAVETIAPGYKFILNQTMWNRTTRLPVYGSESPQEWQREVSMNFTSPYSKYRVQGGSLYFFPVPEAGDTIAFEYESANWVNVAAGGTSNKWMADADTCVFDDDVMLTGLIWRWNHRKGLDYAEDFAIYEKSVEDAISRDGSKKVISTHGDGYSIEPAILVPTGSWSV